MKKLLAVFLFATLTFAAEVKSFRLMTNNANVNVGEAVLVIAELVTDDAVSVNIPQFGESEDFSVLGANRSQSSSTSISIVNGRRTTEKNVTTRFTYQIRFNSQKATVLPPLSLNVGGKQVSTNSITFNVGGSAGGGGDGSGGGGGAAAQRQSPVSVRFIRERSTLYKGEQARLTVRVQLRHGAGAQLTNDGYVRFLNALQEKLGEKFTVSALASSPTNSQEVINGVPHTVYDLAFNLAALDTGRISVPPIPISYIVEERSGGRDPFDGFFGGMFNVRQRQASASSPAFSYTVNEIPRPFPRNFRGIIGEVRLSGTLSADSVSVGDAVTLRVNMSGRMSSAVMGEIELDRNPDLDIFPPERRVTQDTTANGIVTRKQFSWLIVPKKEGTFNIPIREIVWFDPTSATFKTASAGNFTITAGPGAYDQNIRARRYLTQSEIATLGDDIRYIKTQLSTGDIRENFGVRRLFYAFSAIWGVALILVLAKLKTVLFPKNIHEERRSKAYSAAVRDISKKKMSEISAILKYLSAKTGKECGSMKYDEIEKLLESRKVAKETCQKLTAFFREVEMSRYASAASQKNHAKEGVEILKSIDKEIK